MNPRSSSAASSACASYPSVFARRSTRTMTTSASRFRIPIRYRNSPDTDGPMTPSIWWVAEFAPDRVDTAFAPTAISEPRARTIVE